MGATLTNIRVRLVVRLKRLPVDTVLLRVLLEDRVDIGVLELRLLLAGRLGRVVLPRVHGSLNTLVVKVGVVLLLEVAQDRLQLLHLVLQVVPVV